MFRRGFADGSRTCRPSSSGWNGSVCPRMLVPLGDARRRVQGDGVPDRPAGPGVATRLAGERSLCVEPHQALKRLCRLLKLFRDDFHRLETTNPDIAAHIRATAARRRALRKPGSSQV